MAVLRMNGSLYDYMLTPVKENALSFDAWKKEEFLAVFCDFWFEK